MPAFISETPLDLTASVAELCSALAGSALCAVYAKRKHWLANNALGLAFSLTGIESLSMGSVQTGTLRRRDLNDNRFSGSVPPTISALTALTSLCAPFARPGSPPMRRMPRKRTAAHGRLVSSVACFIVNCA